MSTLEKQAISRAASRAGYRSGFKERAKDARRAKELCQAQQGGCFDHGDMSRKIYLHRRSESLCVVLSETAPDHLHEN
jgi:hypothetical protein